MDKRMVRRSGLIFPINNSRFLEKAWTRGCDFLVLDLEDSVPPQQKAYARTLVKDAIPMVGKGGAEVWVRINHDTVKEDLDASIWPGLRRVNYPKTETAEEVRLVDSIITRLEKERGIESGYIEIGANIETALGVANAHEIAAASPRIRDFGGGAGYDMSRDLGVEMFVGFEQFMYGKGELELAGRVRGMEIHAAIFIPDVSGSVSDADYALKIAETDRKLGFYIGGGLHPNVVEPQNRGHTPTAEEISAAKRVIELYKMLEAEGRAWAEVDGRAIDKYEARRAEALLEFAEACAEKDRQKAEAVKAQGGAGA